VGASVKASAGASVSYAAGSEPLPSVGSALPLWAGTSVDTSVFIASSRPPLCEQPAQTQSSTSIAASSLMPVVLKVVFIQVSVIEIFSLFYHNCSQIQISPASKLGLGAA
jgi:hypothetical protein